MTSTDFIKIRRNMISVVNVIILKYLISPHLVSAMSNNCWNPALGVVRVRESSLDCRSSIVNHHVVSDHSQLFSLWFHLEVCCLMLILRNMALQT